MNDTIADIERIEMDAWTDCYAAAPAAFSSAVGLSVQRVGNFGLFAVRKSQKIIFNRSLAIGISEGVDQGTVEKAVTWLRDHCGPMWAVPLAVGARPLDLPEWLSRNGLTLAKPGVAKFRRAATEPVNMIECPYDVRLATAAHAADFGITVRQGFEMNEGFENWFGALCGRPNWRTYVAYDGSTPVGAGAMFLKDGNAWLGIGTTLPTHRGKGVQSAMLARRINDAAALGVNMLTVDTYHAGIGEPANGSHRNVVRAGFSFAYFRPHYVAQ
jgi:GNAT superfamily N-acetyltransferase